jgi:hypothetical protein
MRSLIEIGETAALKHGCRSGEIRLPWSELQFDSILPRWTTRPSRGLALEGGNEIIVVRWRLDESELPNGWVTNEQR